MIFGNDSSWRNEICLDLKRHMSHETIRIEGNSCCFACEYQRRFYNAVALSIPLNDKTYNHLVGNPMQDLKVNKLRTKQYHRYV